MDETIIQKIDNFHYNEGDLIVIYFNMTEPINQCADVVNKTYDFLKEEYNAQIIAVPVGIVPEITTIAADDHLKSMLLEGYKIIKEKTHEQLYCHRDDADDDIWNI